MLPARATRAQSSTRTPTRFRSVPSPPYLALPHPALPSPGTQALCKPSLQATSHSHCQQQGPAWLCHGAGARQDAEGDALRKPSNTPVPSSQAEAKPYLAGCSLRSAGNVNLPPAPSGTGQHHLSPCRAEQPGLGMRARSRAGLRRGERGGMGGACRRHGLPRSSPAQEGPNGRCGCQKGMCSAPAAPLPRAPASDLPDTRNWITARRWRGRREGRAGSCKEPSGLCCSLPLSQAL